jgi:hypothetical protein
MTTYKELFGKAVKYLSTDPTTEAEGQVWYNSTSGTFKSVVATATWSSGSPLNITRRNLAGAGTQTAGLGFGGGPPITGATEEYNGSGWATGGNMGTARYILAGCGTQTAGLAFAGFDTANSNATEEYDGSAWTGGGTLNTARYDTGGAGTQTAGLAFGGFTTTVVGSTEEYNGSSWTSSNSLNTSRQNLAGAGTQTAGLGFGGGPPITGATEEYDGTSWTSGGNLGTARYNLAGAGTQTAGLAFGGGPPNTGATESYNGSTWTASQNLTTARRQLAGAGIQTAALAFGGFTTVAVANTEEYNVSASIITGAAWASGGNLSTARTTAGDCGIQTAGIVMMGNPGTAPYTSNATEEYDGSVWTAGGNTPFSSSDLSGTGTQTAALGFASGDSPTTAVITYDGSTWTTSPATYPPQSPGSQHRGIGTQTAAISVGMGTGSLNWNGSIWTSGPSTNTSRNGQKPAGWGTQTSAIVATGFQNPTTLTSNSESFNGTSFTEEGLVLTAVRRVGGTTSASGSDGFFTGGSTAAGSYTYTTQTQAWDGTVWYTSANLANARLNHMGFGTNNSAAVTGGQLSTGVTNTTEEFTGETSAFNYKTITTS